MDDLFYDDTWDAPEGTEEEVPTQDVDLGTSEEWDKQETEDVIVYASEGEPVEEQQLEFSAETEAVEEEPQRSEEQTADYTDILTSIYVTELQERETYSEILQELSNLRDYYIVGSKVQIGVLCVMLGLLVAMAVFLKL